MLDQVARRLAPLLVAPLLIMLATPAHAASSPPPDRTAALMSPGVLMAEVVAMTNQQRNANGCGALTVSHDLTVASIRQSAYMAETGLFTHVWRDGSTFVTRAHAAGYRQPSGENIAWGYQNVTDVMAAWMASPHHRANILNCGARSIGSGVAYGANGVPYYTEVFGWD